MAPGVSATITLSSIRMQIAPVELHNFGHLQAIAASVIREAYVVSLDLGEFTVILIEDGCIELQRVRKYMVRTS